jgi:hypothetical protein
MAHLFEIQDKIVYPTPEILLLEPFKTIWSRDKSQNKESALEEFAYIEFMSSAKKSNPFKGYSDEERGRKIIEQIMIEKNWKPDHLVLEGINYWLKYQEEASENYTLYKAAKKAVDNLKKFLKTVDVNERKENGTPVYKPKEITGAVVDIPKVTASLNDLKKKVEEDLFEQTKSRSGKTTSVFADPSSL